MQTVVAQVNTEAPASEPIRRAAEILRRGGLVAFPTETVYGLAANALDAEAVARIFAAKGRPAKNPLIVHVADIDAARRLTADWPDLAGRLAERFWPGPLTLVLPKTDAVPDIVTAQGPTVAVRMPAHPVALSLLRSAQLPLAAPSANRSTKLSPTRAEHVLADLEGRIDFVLDAGPTTAGLESTVLDLTTTPPRILRPGPVSGTELEAIIGPVTRAGEPTMDPGPPPSPGMLGRHYAPATPLECMTRDVERVQELAREGRRVGWLTSTPPDIPPNPNMVIVRMPDNPVEYATLLYDVLHRLDTMGLERIVVARPPDTEDWSAIRDRLKRAAARSE
jgi:L-threonylcarbamoyladenylate synthase